VTDIVLLLPQLHDLVERGSAALDLKVLVLELFDRNGFEHISEPADGFRQSVCCSRLPPSYWTYSATERTVVQVIFAFPSPQMVTFFSAREKPSGLMDSTQ
jgi:hypothetical protein